MKGKTWKRYSPKSLETNSEDEKGKLFVSGIGMKDLSSVKVIGESVDTIRQLVKGKLRKTLLERIERILEGSDNIMETPSPLALKWHVAYAGKHSGYQYKLQNNDEGIILLLKSFYADKEKEGAHLKIELSPKFIAARGIKEIGKALNTLAKGCLEEWKMNGCAVHLAIDIQGWEPPEDFGKRFVTRARASQDYQSIQNVVFEGLSNVSVMYGNNESWLFGKSNSLQMAVYRKDIEIEVSDKQDHFYRQWDAYTFGEWDKEAPVWRVEARFHHQVVRELAASQNQEMESWEQVAEYLADLWRYALKINRLDKTSTYIDPVWQLIREEPKFYHPPVGFYLKRKKKEQPGNTHKNYALIIGNLITICARQNYTTSMFMKELKKLSFYDDLINTYKRNGKSEGDLREQVQKGLLLRKMIGMAA
ncbi:MAG: hypothetical protein ABW079_06640 [Sedimenticola sp.]